VDGKKVRKGEGRAFSRFFVVHERKKEICTGAAGHFFSKQRIMQIKLFTIPLGDSGSALAEMNTFLRGNKILEVENQLVNNEHGAY